MDKRSPTGGDAVVLRESRSRSGVGVNRTESRDSDIFLPEDMANRPDSSDVPVELAGMLHKKGRRFKSWKQRYFEIQGNNMYYYKDEKSNDCLGYIDLTKIYYAGKSSAASFGSPFELQTWGRVHLLAARNESDMRKWISVIKSKMETSAKSRVKRGSKADVNAVVPLDASQRRATIKLNRGGGGGVKPPTGRHLSTTLESRNRVILPSTGEETVNDTTKTTIKSSQSFPEISRNKVTTAPLGPSPSDYQINELEEDKTATPTFVDTPTSEHNQSQVTTDLPSQVTFPTNLPLSTSEEAAILSPVPVDLPSQDNINLPPPLIPDITNVGLQSLPSPDEIGLPSSLDNLPSPDEIGFQSPLDNLPSPDEIGLPPFINNLPSPDEIGLPALLNDLPSPDEIGIPVAPLNNLLSPDEIGLPLGDWNDPSDTDTIRNLRELLDKDDSSWKVSSDDTLSPLPEPWLQEDNPIDQLRHFLRVCI